MSPLQGRREETSPDSQKRSCACSHAFAAAVRNETKGSHFLPRIDTRGFRRGLDGVLGGNARERGSVDRDYNLLGGVFGQVPLPTHTANG